MAMSGGDHGNPRGEIQKSIAVNVLHGGATPGFRDQRITPRVGRREDRSIPRDNLFGIWAGERGDEIGKFHFICESNGWWLHGSSDAPASIVTGIWPGKNPSRLDMPCPTGRKELS